MTEMNGHGLVGGAERRQPLKERLHGRCLGRQHRARRIGCAIIIPGQGQNKGAHTPGCAVLARKLILNGRKRASAIARDRPRQRKPATQFVRVMGALSDQVIALRLDRVAQQIVRQTAIGSDLPVGNAQPACFFQKPERGGRLLHSEESSCNAGLDPAITRGDFLGAGVEGHRCLRVAKLQSGFCGPGQRRQVTRAVGQSFQVPIQRCAGALAIPTAERGRLRQSGAARDSGGQQRKPEP
jgi:hypothetical protein